MNISINISSFIYTLYTEAFETLGETLMNTQIQMAKLESELETQHTINREKTIEIDSLKSTIRQIENIRDCKILNTSL